MPANCNREKKEIISDLLFMDEEWTEMLNKNTITEEAGHSVSGCVFVRERKKATIRKDDNKGKQWL